MNTAIVVTAMVCGTVLVLGTFRFIESMKGKPPPAAADEPKPAT